MIEAQIITHWMDGGDLIAPHMIVNYGDSWRDDTGSNVPVSPNSVMLFVTCSESTFTQIEQNTNMYIVWDSPNPKPPHDVPDVAEWAILNAFLARQGYTPEQRREAIGRNPNGRNRRQVADDLKGWIKQR